MSVKLYEFSVTILTNVYTLSVKQTDNNELFKCIMSSNVVIYFHIGEILD